MADKSKIEWTDATWSPITGCTLVSDGCNNCYAAHLAATRLKHHPSRKGLARLNAAGIAKFTGDVRFNEEWLDQPLRWKKPRMIFVCAHGDLFHENVPDEWIDRVFAVMVAGKHHTFQVLTKRPGRAANYLARSLRDGLSWPLPNVWLGTSVEDMETAQERIPYLAVIPAQVRFVSAEPLLGSIDPFPLLYLMDWVIVGGESGRNARPMHPDWARSLRDQCSAAGVAFHFKQWGEWKDGSDFSDDADVIAIDGRHWPIGQSDAVRRADPVSERLTAIRRVGKKNAGRHLDTRTWDEFPHPPRHEDST